MVREREGKRGKGRIGGESEEGAERRGKGRNKRKKGADTREGITKVCRCVSDY